MKRIIAILLILLLLASTASAELTKMQRMKKYVAAMNRAELSEMFGMVMEQMIRWNVSPYSSETGVPVPPGRYTVGTDIPAGAYRLEFPDVEYDSGIIGLYTQSGDLIDYYIVGKTENVLAIGKLELTEGMIFELKSTTATFYKYKGIFNEQKED